MMFKRKWSALCGEQFISSKMICNTAIFYPCSCFHVFIMGSNTLFVWLNDTEIVLPQNVQKAPLETKQLHHRQKHSILSVLVAKWIEPNEEKEEHRTRVKKQSNTKEREMEKMREEKKRNMKRINEKLM